MLHFISQVAHSFSPPLLSFPSTPILITCSSSSTACDFLSFPRLLHALPFQRSLLISHLIPSLLHQTNSYIIQRGNERVGGSARPQQRVNPSPFMYQSRCCPLLVPAPWLAGQAVRQNILGGGVCVLGLIVHADEHPHDTLSISIAPGLASRRAHTHAHTRMPTHALTNKRRAHNIHSCFFFP